MEKSTIEELSEPSYPKLKTYPNIKKNCIRMIWVLNTTNCQAGIQISPLSKKKKKQMTSFNFCTKFRDLCQIEILNTSFTMSDQVRYSY